MPSTSSPLRYFSDKVSGMSLMSMLVAMAIMGVVLMVIAQNMTNISKKQKKLEELGDISDLRRIFRAKIACGQTKAGVGGSWNHSVCSSGNSIEGRNSSNQIVIAATGSTIGKYTLNLQCAMTGTSASMLLGVKKGDTLLTNNVFKKVPYICPP